MYMQRVALSAAIAGITALLLAGCSQPTNSDNTSDSGGGDPLADTAWVDVDGADVDGDAQNDPETDVVFATDKDGRFVRVLYQDYTGKNFFSDNPVEPTSYEDADERETGGTGTYEVKSEGTMSVAIAERYYYDFDGSEGGPAAWGWYDTQDSMDIDYSISEDGQTLTVQEGTPEERQLERIE